MATEAQGTKIFWSASTAQSTAVEVTGIQSFTGPSGSAGVIDVTTLGSTAKEKLMGLPDEGQISFEMLLDLTDTGQSSLRDDRAARTKKNVGIKLTDASSSLIFADAYCTNFSIAGGVDDAVKASVTLEITGPLTWSTN